MEKARRILNEELDKLGWTGAELLTVPKVTCERFGLPGACGLK